jgi:signal transduction histidine kinase
LRLTVQDNGVGAPPQAFEAANAYGVMGMRERARHFGGDIQIDSAPGQGTRMCLTVTLGDKT